MVMSRGETGTFIVLDPLDSVAVRSAGEFLFKNGLGRARYTKAPAQGPTRSLRNPSGQASKRSHLEIQSRHLECFTAALLDRNSLGNYLGPAQSLQLSSFRGSPLFARDDRHERFADSSQTLSAPRRLCPAVGPFGTLGRLAVPRCG